MIVDVFFFFYKQKTAYEIQYGLVGSEMCIRDSLEVMRCSKLLINRNTRVPLRSKLAAIGRPRKLQGEAADVAEEYGRLFIAQSHSCLLYNSGAADERSSVGLGGRRIL